ncbi:MAG TPA: ABC transporter permease [Spirochaetia bacterium]|nr:ABC transporter permease [Spirochaetia bacterium]
MISSRTHPPFAGRILAVWYRHYRVYTKNLISNGLPPFLEPLIFLAGIGLGMGKYVTRMQNMPYIVFLATGLPITAAMFTAAFECSFGTFIRLEFDKVYDGMLAAPISANDLLMGEILWAGTKGLFFSVAVISMEALFGIVPLPLSFLTGIVGFLTGLMFATIALLVTSFVSTINHFNFFFTGFLSPMFFFSGVVFPLENLPSVLRPVAEVFPLTHSVRMARSLDLGLFSPELGFDLVCILGFIVITGYFAIRRLKRKLIQ